MVGIVRCIALADSQIHGDNGILVVILIDGFGILQAQLVDRRLAVLCVSRTLGNLLGTGGQGEQQQHRQYRR